MSSEKRVTRHAQTGLYVRAAPGLRLRDKKVERLARKVRELLTWLEPSDLPSVRAWCELEVLSQHVYAELRTHGVLSPETGDARRLLHDYRQLRQTQAIWSRELGMTPASRMAMKASGTHAALDIASLMAQEPDEAEVVVPADKPEGRAKDNAQKRE